MYISEHWLQTADVSTLELTVTTLLVIIVEARAVMGVYWYYVLGTNYNSKNLNKLHNMASEKNFESYTIKIDSKKLAIISVYHSSQT